jgi:hypothetical protein
MCTRCTILTCQLELVPSLLIRNILSGIPEVVIVGILAKNRINGGFPQTSVEARWSVVGRLLFLGGGHEIEKDLPFVRARFLFDSHRSILFFDRLDRRNGGLDLCLSGSLLLLGRGFVGHIFFDLLAGGAFLGGDRAGFSNNTSRRALADLLDLGNPLLDSTRGGLGVLFSGY